MKGIEAADGGESPSGQHRRVSPQGSRVGAPTPPTRGSAQSRHALPSVLAARSMAKLLDTYIGRVILPGVISINMVRKRSKVSRVNAADLVGFGILRASVPGNRSKISGNG